MAAVLVWPRAISVPAPKLVPALGYLSRTPVPVRAGRMKIIALRPYLAHYAATDTDKYK
jgi:hypothetical protein